jgi:hypothetical protein
MNPNRKLQFETKDTEYGERVTLSGHIILSMPLTPGAMSGRSYTASCTLCRDRRLAMGEPSGPTVGALGFFRDESHRDRIINNHLKAHDGQGDLVHVVHLPRRVRLMNLEDEIKDGNRQGLRGDRSAANHQAGRAGQEA